MVSANLPEMLATHLVYAQEYERWLDAGFVADVDWYIALLYGLGTSLVANGVADTGFVQCRILVGSASLCTLLFCYIPVPEICRKYAAM